MEGLHWRPRELNCAELRDMKSTPANTNITLCGVMWAGWVNSVYCSAVWVAYHVHYITGPHLTLGILILSHGILLVFKKIDV